MPANETCDNCKYFVRLGSSDQPDKGTCHYNPPKQVDNAIGEATDDGRWPLCFASEWCGRWAKRV